MQIQFANYQYLMSEKARKYPRIGKMVLQLFGTTNIGQYARADIFKKMIKELPTDQFLKVLDLGCGQGEYAFMMAEKFPKADIMALDPEQKRIDKIRSITCANGIDNLKTFHGIIEDLTHSYTYDFIYSVDVFEHIREEEMPFEAAYDRLNAGGYLFIKMPSKIQATVFPERFFERHNQWLEEEHIGQVYMLDDLEKRMIESGFKIIHASYSDGYISRLSWELSYLFKKIHPILNLAALPILKGLIKLDRLVHKGNRGNAIQVIAKKP